MVRPDLDLLPLVDGASALVGVGDGSAGGGPGDGDAGCDTTTGEDGRDTTMADGQGVGGDGDAGRDTTTGEDGRDTTTGDGQGVGGVGAAGGDEGRGDTSVGTTRGERGQVAVELEGGPAGVKAAGSDVLGSSFTVVKLNRCWMAREPGLTLRINDIRFRHWGWLAVRGLMLDSLPIAYGTICHCGR